MGLPSYSLLARHIWSIVFSIVGSHNHKGDEGIEASLLGGQAERVGTIQLGEEQAQVALI